VSLSQITTIRGLHEHLELARRSGRRIGLVPTMGALHDGHASLIKTACVHTDLVVTTIFVNPLQFGPKEDLAAYPRDLENDRSIAEAAGATVLFTPSVEEMYPFGARNVLTNVSVREISEVLDGAHRPGHFDGVATVVAKLFAMVGSCSAFFGEKDFQQLAVIKRMCADLSFPVDIIGCPTVRETTGLAMSSRNRYLTDDERQRAAILHQTLQKGRELIEQGATSPEAVERSMVEMANSEPVVQLDYAVVVDSLTLCPVASLAGELRLLLAARVGKARLIDNIGAVSPHVRPHNSHDNDLSLRD
jgi:pantoate--beta-alanine ligase